MLVQSGPIIIERVMANAQQKDLIDAASFFSEAARTLLTTDNLLHAETLIMSVARMAGSMTYRSFNLDKVVEPGAVVLSDQANRHGAKLVALMLTTLQRLGDPVEMDSLDNSYASSRYSQLTFKETHERLAPFFLRYCEVASMSFQDAALAAAMATAILIHDCREVLSADKGGAIAVYGFVEGTKTAPFPLDSSDCPSPAASPAAPTAAASSAASPHNKKPWYRLW